MSDESPLIPREADEKVLLRFRPEMADKDAQMIQDTADEYIVLEWPAANNGIICYGRMDGDSRGWIANWGDRPIIKYLLDRVKELEGMIGSRDKAIDWADAEIRRLNSAKIVVPESIKQIMAKG